MIGRGEAFAKFATAENRVGIILATVAYEHS